MEKSLIAYLNPENWTYSRFWKSHRNNVIRFVYSNGVNSETPIFRSKMFLFHALLLAAWITIGRIKRIWKREKERNFPLNSLKFQQKDIVSLSHMRILSNSFLTFCLHFCTVTSVSTIATTTTALLSNRSHRYKHAELVDIDENSSITLLCV